MKRMPPLVIVSAIVLLSLTFISWASPPLSNSEKKQNQDSVRDMANQTLTQLYAKYPAIKTEISKLPGYAVFSDFGMKNIYMGGAGGSGIAVNNATKQETFMKMAEFKPGSGLGAEKFRVVFVFETLQAFNTFVTSGWEAGANVMAAAKAKSMGEGAVTVSEVVRMFQLNEEGLIVRVSITGAKYYRDKELN
jgi:lipid-binding SYLF domain-containing protein